MLSLKKAIQLSIVLFFPAFVFCQDNFSARLSISGSVSGLGISPSEEIWVATKAGNIYYTKHIGELWHLGSFGSLNPLKYSSGNTFERINFFSEDTLMISGFIQDNGKEDFVYWSANHGKNWQKIRFGKSSWLDAGYINNNGKAWLSGSSQLIYYSQNSGNSWTSFNKVEPIGNLRFSSVFFSKDERTGLFGSTWNVLYRTKDNCESWEKIPTPLNQNKYKMLSKDERPEIEKIRIFGNNYIIKQQNRVFITQSNLINWIYLPNVLDFEVTESYDLYTINKNLSIDLFNSNFNRIWHSEKNLLDNPICIGVRNQNLFALSSEYLYKINQHEFISSQLFTNDTEIEEPYLQLNFEEQKFGFEKNDVLMFDQTKNKWLRFMTMDFPISNATVYDNKLLIANKGLHKYFSLNQKNKTIEEVKLPSNLFSNKKVSKVYFENGFQGCFAQENQHRLYNKILDKFIVNKDSSSVNYLSKSKDEIDEVTIQNILNVIDTSRFLKVTLPDLKISENDIKEFKKFIDRQTQHIKKNGVDRFDFDNLYSFPGEFTDFDFYKSAADSLFKVSDDIIDEVFWQSYGNWSTTTKWRRLIFIFDDGKNLVIENSDDKTNYLYTPWLVNYDGLKFRSNSIKFGKCIDEITNTQFFDKDSRDKNYAIFKITDYLYRKMLLEK